MRDSLFSDSSLWLKNKSQYKGQQKKFQWKLIMLLFILSSSSHTNCIGVFTLQFSSFHLQLQQVSFAKKEQMSIADENIIERYVFASFPPSPLPPLLFDLSPLRQTQVISAVLLSSACLLRQTGSWAAVSKAGP